MAGSAILPKTFGFLGIGNVKKNCRWPDGPQPGSPGVPASGCDIRLIPHMGVVDHNTACKPDQWHTLAAVDFAPPLMSMICRNSNNGARRQNCCKVLPAKSGKMGSGPGSFAPLAARRTWGEVRRFAWGTATHKATAATSPTDAQPQPVDAARRLNVNRITGPVRPCPTRR